MKILVAKTYEQMSRKALTLVKECIAQEPQGLVSFPGGDTPVEFLRLFTQAVKSGEIDHRDLKFVQLDDWVGVGPEDEGSCSHFIHHTLLEKLPAPFADVFCFDGRAADIDAQLAAQDRFIRDYGPISVEMLGIGMNGHLGFNENGVDPTLRSHRTPLSETTLTVQKKYFGGKEVPLTEGITQGIAQIMESKTVLLLANGKKKADIIRQAVIGPVTNQVPASFLQRHDNCYVLLDEEAASQLPEEIITRV